jgi:hypothetical protein
MIYFLTKSVILRVLYTSRCHLQSILVENSVNHSSCVKKKKKKNHVVQADSILSINNKFTIYTAWYSQRFYSVHDHYSNVQSGFRHISHNPLTRSYTPARLALTCPELGILMVSAGYIDHNENREKRICSAHT